MGVRPAAYTDKEYVMNSKAVIRIATDVVSDAELIRKLLWYEFDNLALSSDASMAVSDFEGLISRMC